LIRIFFFIKPAGRKINSRDEGNFKGARCTNFF